MTKSLPNISFEVVDPDKTLTLDQFCTACHIEPDLIIEMIAEGVIEPVGSSKSEWTFSFSSVARTQRAFRLQRDLEINLPGVALSVDLLDEIDQLRLELKILQHKLSLLE